MPANAKLWSPDSPFLYMEVTLYKDGKAIDRVKSYTAMRKYSIRKVRMAVNWTTKIFPVSVRSRSTGDGGLTVLYTAPTDETLVLWLEEDDGLQLQLMVRKHVKK